ncbi:hypothetical protein L345_15988, partial [Ophiophagus hannah]
MLVFESIFHSALAGLEKRRRNEKSQFPLDPSLCWKLKEEGGRKRKEKKGKEKGRGQMDEGRKEGRKKRKEGS